MTVHPQQSRIVCEPIDEPGETILIPGTVDALEYKRLKVIAVGTGRVLDSGVIVQIPLEVGDEIVAHGAGVIKLDPITFYQNRTLYVIDYAHVLAKIEREPGEIAKTPAKKEIVKPQLQLVH